MKWTEELPKTSGYYWFSECYEDTARIIWIELSLGFLSTFDLNCYDQSYLFTGKEGYWFSSEPIRVLRWENT